MQNILLLFMLLLLSCGRGNSQPVGTGHVARFTHLVKVEMIGYDGDIMEPFLSRDGNILLFNNLNSAPENTNLHWATKIKDATFQYRGEVSGVNTADLEGVPTMDNSGNLYFVSNRNYETTLSTLYQANFSNGTATNVQLIGGVSRLQPGWVNFDIETSADGQTLYFVDAQFGLTGNPKTADIVIATKNGSGFQRSSNSSEIMQNVNTDALEYAACISANQLELYFTRVEVAFTAASFPGLFISTRPNIKEPFGVAYKIPTIKGFVEAMTIAPDQKTFYFHKKESNRFVLYMVRRK
ncbi:MAG: hypothetical protein ABL984_18585 [Pyrinomonadaceae bacterium]